MSVNASSANQVARALAVAALLPFAAPTASAADGASLPAPVAQPTPSAPALPQADAPAFAVGEAWTFAYKNALEPAKDDTYTQTVSGVAADGSATLNGGAVALDPSGNLVKTATSSYTPSDCKLRFPLFIGAAWSASYVYRSGAWVSSVDRQAKVVAIERVETRAGVFDAFKIEQAASWSGAQGNRGYGVTRETDWYAPVVGRVVKTDYIDRPTHGAPTVTHVVLIGFKPASASASASAAHPAPQ